MVQDKALPHAGKKCLQNDGNVSKQPQNPNTSISSADSAKYCALHTVGANKCLFDWLQYEGERKQGKQAQCLPQELLDLLYRVLPKLFPFIKAGAD